jgi:hypothetical protein
MGCEAGAQSRKTPKRLDNARLFLLESAFAFLNPPVLSLRGPHWHNRAAKFPVKATREKEVGNAAPLRRA